MLATQTGRPIALVLEDEPLISMDVEQTLESAGFDVVAVGTCADAHSFLDRTTPAVAIVDIVLADGPCGHVATRLIQANVPFVVHSGDEPGLHTDTPFAVGIWVNKPSAASEFMAATLTAVAG